MCIGQNSYLGDRIQINLLLHVAKPTDDGRSMNFDTQGNLAHNLLLILFACFTFQLDISKPLKTKNIECTGKSQSYKRLKIKFGNPLTFRFPIIPCVTSLHWGITSKGKSNSWVDSKINFSFKQ